MATHYRSWVERVAFEPSRRLHRSLARANSSPITSKALLGVKSSSLALNRHSVRGSTALGGGVALASRPAGSAAPRVRRERVGSARAASSSTFSFGPFLI
ncbi:hypothetical protein EVAR_94644_1 [Eumeta japonica]|uniref:Uncharacterized protein n=1 Tax=Eumeta variegata TaxID=151549 RepID=A0A4C1UVI9_EUMVA|nr:hypothetical protein EVAR_94644_1 [Eumeta japonica]